MVKSLTTWTCLKAAVSCVMCSVRHLDVHLALLILSWTSSCSGEVLRATATVNSAQSWSRRAAPRWDMLLNKQTVFLDELELSQWVVTVLLARPLSCEWKHLLLAARGPSALLLAHGHSHHRFMCALITAFWQEDAFTCPFLCWFTLRVNLSTRSQSYAFYILFTLI